MTKAIVGLIVTIFVALADTGWARVIKSDDFERYPSGNVDCAALLAGGWDGCKEAPVVRYPENSSDISIVTSIPGYSGAMCSGSKAMRMYADARIKQTDVHVGTGIGDEEQYNNYIPAVAWFQVCVYINYSSSELSTTLGRTMKFFYPCADIYPCRDNYWLLEMGTNSYNPFQASHGDPSSGNLYISSQARTTGDPYWASGPQENRHKIGQTSLAEWIKPNRWNVLRCRTDFSNITAAKLDCWIGAKGTALINVMSWHGGTPVEGSDFTWTIPVAKGSRTFSIPTTVPSPNRSGPELFMYLDDFMIATSEEDLPRY
ncbi:MAG: hypothetical protein A4E20_03420 [Nitrospira sp. SG-bin2]|uniref:hypothetical protein n=1 Tax=Nitrospira cf. moscoviensis SBR1015 TaxID=96242 RepID=UPI000A097F03|nr:hypothetical protein [Nitrospira cf. moscoviensis SBR1015]OQW32182.1 MAG: hypothetical protein A4E20_03420 [Nitrospira sp. SG-bin2]